MAALDSKSQKMAEIMKITCLNVVKHPSQRCIGPNTTRLGGKCRYGPYDMDWSARYRLYRRGCTLTVILLFITWFVINRMLSSHKIDIEFKSQMMGWMDGMNWRLICTLEMHVRPLCKTSSAGSFHFHNKYQKMFKRQEFHQFFMVFKRNISKLNYS